MAVRRHANDHHRLDRDLEVAYDRIAGLRASARAERTAGTSGGAFLAGLRDTIGRRLIAIGTALVTDDSLRRRPALRP